ncbi:hypothetical protein J6590_060489 [Homalodisca vitripennis]|nr:hypothetical protein J6590_060489 [Homalodisca vitripennis]
MGLSWRPSREGIKSRGSTLDPWGTPASADVLESSVSLNVTSASSRASRLCSSCFECADLTFHHRQLLLNCSHDLYAPAPHIARQWSSPVYLFYDIHNHSLPTSLSSWGYLLVLEYKTFIQDMPVESSVESLRTSFPIIERLDKKVLKDSGENSRRVSGRESFIFQDLEKAPGGGK